MKMLFVFLVALVLLSIISTAQNVGIGTTGPKAAFNIAAGKTVLFGADSSGAGIKLIWIPNKGAFRAGIVTGDLWNNINVGQGSVALGEDTKATGQGSVAMGSMSIADNYFAVAIGHGTMALSEGSNALGYLTNALGNYSIAACNQASASGLGSVSMGNFTKASGQGSTAFGNGTNSSGYATTTLGYGTTASSVASVKIGQFNTESANALFMIGNGISGDARSNALTVLSNGNTSIAGNLTVSAGKGIVRSGDATTRKIITTEVTVNTTIAAGGTYIIPFIFIDPFTATPDVYVGNVTSGGGFAELIMSIADIYIAGGNLFINNPMAAP